VAVKDRGSAVEGTDAVIEATVVSVAGISSGISSESDDGVETRTEGSMVA